MNYGRYECMCRTGNEYTRMESIVKLVVDYGEHEPIAGAHCYCQNNVKDLNYNGSMERSRTTNINVVHLHSNLPMGEMKPSPSSSSSNLIMQHTHKHN